jgi:hypothetical protein
MAAVTFLNIPNIRSALPLESSARAFLKSSKAASPKNQKAAKEELKALLGRSIFFLPEVPNHEIFQKVKNRVVL